MAAAILVALAIAAQAPLMLGLVQAAPSPGEASVNGEVVLPALADAAAVLEGGEWPWWNPFARLGEPFMASGVQPLYPGFWPLLFFGASALPWVLALHSALACVFMFRWLRALPASRFAAFLGGGFWGAGIFFQLQLQRLPEAAACAWLPLALEGVWRLTRPGRTPPFVAAVALGIAAMFATGAHATPAVGAGLCLVLGTCNLLCLHRSDRMPALFGLGLAGIGAALLAAPFWLDAIQNGTALEHGHSATGGGLPSLFAALAPLHLTALAASSDGSDPFELALFPGTLVLMLLVLALVRPSPARPRWPWLAVAALGAAGNALDGKLPGCSLALVQLAALVLACQGLDAFLEDPFRRPAAALGLAAGAAALGLVGLAACVLQPQFLADCYARAVGLAASTAAERAAAAGQALLPTSLSLLLLGLAMLTWRRLGILRFKVTLAVLVFGELGYLAWAMAPQRAVPPDVDVVGTGGARVLATDLQSGARLARGRAPTRRVNSVGDSVLARTRAFLDDAAPGALANGARVRFGTVASDRFEPRLASLAQIDVLLGDHALVASPFAAPAGPEGAAQPAPTPFARLVFQARFAADTAAARQDLRTRPSPSTSVVVEGDLGAFAPRMPPRPGSVHLLEETAGKTRVRVDTNQGRGFLVLADAFAPGWKATIDGEPVPVLAADVAFRAVAVPEGEHEIELTYAPWAKVFGLPLSGVGAVFVLACFAKLRRRRRRA